MPVISARSIPPVVMSRPCVVYSVSGLFTDRWWVISRALDPDIELNEWIARCLEMRRMTRLHKIEWMTCWKLGGLVSTNSLSISRVEGIYIAR